MDDRKYKAGFLVNSNINKVKLSVNVDHVATLREARRTYEPEPTHAAVLAMLGGADGITVHVRQDRRHVKEKDAELIKNVIPLPLTVEMGLFDDIFRFIVNLKPKKVTLVPERTGEVTTEGGLDVISNENKVRKFVDELKAAGVEPGIFVDPVEDIIGVSKDIGASFIEINTTFYVEADGAEKEEQLARIRRCASHGKTLGLYVQAGHALNYKNVAKIAEILEIDELSIGHSIVSRAVLVGFEKAVREMKEIMERARR